MWTLKLGNVLDETESFLCGEGGEGALASSIRRDLYALIHVILSDTKIQVYLHKKYYLSIG